jgi:uncharacterized protein (DUF2235 family)
MIWFIQNIAFSVSLIVIIHYLYLYFESTLTTPKVKDLIHCPKQKYNSLFETINSKLHHDVTNGRNKNSYTDSNEDSTASTTATMDHSGLGIVNRKNNGSDLGGIDDNDDNLASSSSAANKNTTMKNDLKSFLRTIGLKKQSTQPSRAPYEMN